MSEHCQAPPHPAAHHLQDRHAVCAVEAVCAHRHRLFLTGLGYYACTFATQGRFTNMSVLLFSAAVIVFLIGLISEQITNLTYRQDR